MDRAGRATMKIDTTRTTSLLAQPGSSLSL